MRFPRNAKIFRGQMDAAPAAGVFFLLLAFLALQSRMAFTPGLRLDLRLAPSLQEQAAARRTVSILPDGRIGHLGEEITEKSLRTLLAERQRRGGLEPEWHLAAPPGSDRAVADRVAALLRGAGVKVTPPPERLEIPAAAGYGGTSNAALHVSINLSGQVFFENHLVRQSQLELELRQAAAGLPKPVTMVLHADRHVTVEELVGLGSIARSAGLDEVLVAVRPQPTPPAP